MGRSGITTVRGRRSRSFAFAYGVRASWIYALIVIPVAVLGFFSLLFVLIALVLALPAIAIGARWFLSRTPRRRGSVTVHRRETQEIAPRLKRTIGSQQ